MQAADETEVVQYKPVSPVALVALGMGVFAALAVVNVLFLIVPIAALVLSLYAIWTTRRNDSAVVGHGLALIALALAVLFASWSLAKTTTRTLTLHGQAEQFVMHWFELIVEGRVHEAHELMLPVEERLPPGSSLEDAYKQAGEARPEERPGDVASAKRSKDFGETFGVGFLKRLAEGPGSKSFRLIERTQQSYNDIHHFDQIVQRYECTFGEGANARREQVTVVVDRKVHRSAGIALWQIRSVSEK